MKAKMVKGGFPLLQLRKKDLVFLGQPKQRYIYVSIIKITESFQQKIFFFKEILLDDIAQQ